MAERILTAIEEKLLLISDSLGIGSRRVTSLPEVCVFPVGAYLLFYTPHADGGGIDLIRVLHGARNWQAYFGSED